MTCYMIKLRFDGTNYAGYQRQANANTVGEEVLKALTAFFGSVEALSGCSRTDSGVHANCYCASFRAEKRAEPDRVVRGLNGLLPRDISVFDCCEGPPEFHARYSVKSKEYVYYILNSRIRDPFYEKYALLFPLPLDTEELNRECEAFVGTHDFSAFCAAGASVGDKTRTVESARFERQGDLVSFRVRGDGFLYNMVRIMVGTCLDIAAGKIEKGKIKEIIDSGDRKNAGHTAPAHGLFLDSVIY